MTLVQRLTLLISTTVAILLGAWVYDVALFRRSQEAAVGNEAARVLSLVAAEYDAFTERSGEALNVAAIVAPDAIAEPNRCQAIINSLRDANLEWLRLDWLDAHGIVRCSTAKAATGTDMSGYPEVIAARTEGRLRLGNYVWGLFSDTPGLVMARPWVGPDGETGVVAGVAQLHPFGASIRGLLPKGYRVFLADFGGRVLAAEPQGRETIGGMLPPPLEALARNPSRRLLRREWSDGTERLIAHSPANVQHRQGVFMALSIDPAVTVTDTGFPHKSGAVTLIAALATIMLAWWGGVRFIRCPLAELTAVALRWRNGDKTARVALPGRSEVAELGRAFDAMADAKDQSDRQTREGIELLTALIESSQDCIFVFDNDGRLLIANGTFVEVTGVKRNLAIGGRLLIAHDPDAQHSINELCTRVVEKRIHQGADLGMKGPDQQMHILQIICAPIFDDYGEVRAVAGIGRDITETREAAERLCQARDRAEAADRAKTGFLAAASHDLRQPLQAATMLAELVVEKTENTTPAAMLAESLCRALDDLRRLVDSLFDISRFDSGAVHPEFTCFPLQLLLNEIAGVYLSPADRKGISLVVAATDAVVRSDRILLGRMLSNLIENAVKYTQTGCVTIECLEQSGFLQISVIDTGIGISSTDQSRIWLEFEQLHNQQRDRRQGLGLGLAIVQRLAVLLEHPVSVQSELGQGSCFVVSVPLADPILAASAGRPLADKANVVGVRGCVIVIDDDPMVLEVLSMVLEQDRWDVLAATDANDAVERMVSAELVPDVAIVDYRLGGGQVGADAIAAVRRAVGREVPAVILSGELANVDNSSDPLIRDARRVGAVLMSKPVRSRELIDSISRLIATPKVSTAPEVAAT